MDRFEQLISDSQIAAAILGNPASGDYQLVNLTSLPLSTEDQASFSTRGMSFLGVLGVCDGVPRSALAVELDPATIAALAGAFTQVVVRALTEKSAEQGNRGDGADWLRKLFNLPDNRKEEMN